MPRLHDSEYFKAAVEITKVICANPNCKLSPYGTDSAASATQLADFIKALEKRLKGE